MYQVSAIVFNSMRGWTRVSLSPILSNNDDMIAWVRQNATNFWFTSFHPKTFANPTRIRRFYFQDAADAVAFKLRWCDETVNI